MLWTKRDSKRGGERFPIPTEGEIEGKLIVLESIAIACVRGSISRGELSAIGQLRGDVATLVSERCGRLNLSEDDNLAAREYALEFFDAVVEETLKKQGAGTV